VESWAPFFVAFIGVLGAAVTYLLQRRSELRDAKIQKKQDVYVDYLDSVLNFENHIPLFMAIDGSVQRLSDANARRRHCSNRVTLFASDVVIEALDECNNNIEILNRHTLGNQGQAFPDELTLSHWKSYSALIKKMREDIKI
jgi:hypothetical protein